MRTQLRYLSFVYVHQLLALTHLPILIFFKPVWVVEREGLYLCPHWKLSVLQFSYLLGQLEDNVQDEKLFQPARLLDISQLHHLLLHLHLMQQVLQTA